MYYGEGAGNRRKRINSTVEQRSKDPVYKKAFEDAFSKQDMAKHAKKAKSERMRKNVINDRRFRNALNAVATIGISAAAIKIRNNPKAVASVGKAMNNIGKKKLSSVNRSYINPMDEFKKYRGDLGYYA